MQSMIQTEEVSCTGYFLQYNKTIQIFILYCYRKNYQRPIYLFGAPCIQCALMNPTNKPISLDVITLLDGILTQLLLKLYRYEQLILQNYLYTYQVTADLRLINTQLNYQHIKSQQSAEALRQFSISYYVCDLYLIVFNINLLNIYLGSSSTMGMVTNESLWSIISTWNSTDCQHCLTYWVF